MNPIPRAPLATASPPELHRICIGCAGWAVPRQHRHHFAGAGSALERYASRLDAVEINSSFYRPHQRKTYERWASSVPTEFRFSVKVPKSITHEHSLAGTAPLVDRFLGECLQLDRKLGGVLVQLPPSLRFDARLANTFFGVLRRRLPDGIAIACEPRHASWFAPRGLAIWNRYQVNRISADPTPAPASGAIQTASESYGILAVLATPRVATHVLQRIFARGPGKPGANTAASRANQQRMGDLRQYGARPCCRRRTRIEEPGRIRITRSLRD